MDDQILASLDSRLSKREKSGQSGKPISALSRAEPVDDQSNHVSTFQGRRWSRFAETSPHTSPNDAWVSTDCSRPYYFDHINRQERSSRDQGNASAATRAIFCSPLTSAAGNRSNGS